MDVSNDPVYPFGYGLSYTSFSYSDLTLSRKSLKGESILSVTVNVTNTGAFTGKEVVQLYIRDKVGSVTRPVKELKAFRKIELKPGEQKKVRFDLSTEDLKFYDSDLNFGWEPGEFEIMVGPNSRDVTSETITWMK